MSKRTVPTKVKTQVILPPINRCYFQRILVFKIKLTSSGATFEFSSQFLPFNVDCWGAECDFNDDPYVRWANVVVCVLRESENFAAYYYLCFICAISLILGIIFWSNLDIVKVISY